MSELFIESLEVVPGTDILSGDCLNQDWSGTFSMAIASLSILSVDDLGASFGASGCGTSVSDGL